MSDNLVDVGVSNLLKLLVEDDKSGNRRISQSVLLENTRGHLRTTPHFPHRFDLPQWNQIHFYNNRLTFGPDLSSECQPPKATRSTWICTKELSYDYWRTDPVSRVISEMSQSFYYNSEVYGENLLLLHVSWACSMYWHFTSNCH